MVREDLPGGRPAAERTASSADPRRTRANARLRSFLIILILVLLLILFLIVILTLLKLVFATAAYQPWFVAFSRVIGIPDHRRPKTAKRLKNTIRQAENPHVSSHK